MMRLTRAGEYGVRAVLHLAAQPEGKVTFVGEISEKAGCAEALCCKGDAFLVKSGVVRSRIEG